MNRWVILTFQRITPNMSERSTLCLRRSCCGKYFQHATQKPLCYAKTLSAMIVPLQAVWGLFLEVRDRSQQKILTIPSSKRTSSTLRLRGNIRLQNTSVGLGLLFIGPTLFVALGMYTLALGFLLSHQTFASIGEGCDGLVLQTTQERLLRIRSVKTWPAQKMQPPNINYWCRFCKDRLCWLGHDARISAERWPRKLITARLDTHIARAGIHNHTWSQIH